jgi:cob(I)alamin adenosyltransferase
MEARAMVRLSKIYTKTGDAGETGLGDGSRVAKTDPRVEAYGTVDEANAAIGLAVLSCDRAAPALARIRALLLLVQNDLFDVGADLCCPLAPGEKPGARLRVTPAQSERLERAIDEHNEKLAPLNSFVLPGGSPLASALHVARTVVRRAERRVVTLMETDRTRTNPDAVIYLNRLSDLLFVLARVANSCGADDVLWKPGANREA